MNPTCPKCGAAFVEFRESWSGFECGTSVAGSHSLRHTEQCLRRQRDSLLLENAALRKAQKAAWDEGYDSGLANHVDGDRAWSLSEAKRIHDGGKP